MDENENNMYPLEVTVFRGKDIHTFNQLQKKAGSEDERPTSFVTLKYQKQSWSGSNVRGKNPVWNTYTTFEDVSIVRTKLRVDVMDVNAIDEKHLVGHIIVPLDMMKSSYGFVQKWLPLNDDPTHSRGLIKIKMVWLNPIWEEQQKEADAKPCEKLPTPMSPESASKYKRQQADKEAGWFRKAQYDDDGMPQGPIKKVDTEGMDTDQIIYETERTQGESLASTKRALAQLHETKELGAAVAVELDRQGRQMKSVEHQLDTIDAVMDDSARKIRATKSIAGAIANLFTRNKSKKKLKKLAEVQAQDAAWRPPSEGGEISDERREIANRNKMHMLGKMHEAPPEPEDPKMAKKNKKNRKQLMEDVQPVVEPEKSSDPVQAQIDDNLDEMGSALTDLKKMALHMGHEINDHSDTINAMQMKTAKADMKIRTQAAILKRPVETRRREV